MPRARNVRTMRKTSSVSAPESDDVGSSKISKLEPCWMARQMPTNCLPAGLSRSKRQSAATGKWCSSIIREACSIMRRQLTSARIERAHGEDWVARTDAGDIRLRPFGSIHDEVYQTYWDVAV